MISARSFIYTIILIYVFLPLSFTLRSSRRGITLYIIYTNFGRLLLGAVTSQFLLAWIDLLSNRTCKIQHSNQRIKLYINHHKFKIIHRMRFGLEKFKSPSSAEVNMCWPSPLTDICFCTTKCFLMIHWRFLVGLLRITNQSIDKYLK